MKTTPAIHHPLTPREKQLTFFWGLLTWELFMVILFYYVSGGWFLPLCDLISIFLSAGYRGTVHERFLPLTIISVVVEFGSVVLFTISFFMKCDHYWMSELCYHFTLSPYPQSDGGKFIASVDQLTLTWTFIAVWVVGKLLLVLPRGYVAFCLKPTLPTIDTSQKVIPQDALEAPIVPVDYSQTTSVSEKPPGK